MDIKINHNCPSCSAPLEITESDRVTVCLFCGVQNYMVNEGLLRYVLPDKIPDHVDNQDRFYFPYLRFKGNIYTCQGNELDYKMLDTTYQGITARFAAPSLGLRPQAMKVNFVSGTLAGRFLKRTETKAGIFRRAALMSQIFSDKTEGPPYHRAFIGESLSCIYLPMYIEAGRVFDGVLNVPLADVEPWLTDEQNLVDFKPEWQLSFLATICPKCGAAMEGESDSLVLHCYNCESCSTEKNGKFIPVPFELLPSTAENVEYIPFWRIKVESQGIVMKSLADLLRVTNQPIVVTEHHKNKGLELWIPALKLRPKIFLNLAKNATLSQLKFPEGETCLDRPMHQVTLPLSEALQALKTVVAETTVHRKEVLPKLPSLTFSTLQTSLTFLPFEDTGHDLVQTHSALSIASSIVKSGRKS